VRSFRRVLAVASLCAAAACNFEPSGGASPGGSADGGAVGAADSAPGTGGDDATTPLALCAPASGLVACYQFESTLADGSPMHNDLTGDGYAFAGGSAGNALSLDDASAMGAIDDASLDMTNRVTVEAWIDPAEAQGRWFVDHDNRWGLEIQDDDSLRCTVRVDVDEEESSGIEVTGGAAPAGAWTHVACTYDGAAVVLYVGGVEVDSSSASGPIHVGDGGGFSVGRDAPDGDSFVGLIDTVRIWSLARGAGDIACSAAGDC